MRPLGSIAWLVLAAAARAQDLGDGDTPPAPSVDALVRRLEQRVGELEAERDARRAQSGSIDLSGDETSALEAPAHDHVLARPWFENVELSGYGAAGYLDTGDPGTAPDGSFLVNEASLFLEAEVWERTSLFSELVLTRYPGGGGVRMGELHLHWSGLLASEDRAGIGAKLGRFEIPFGEEYFRWDAHETPFVSLSAADPYGVDEGLELYGAIRGVHWIAAVTNGSEGNGGDDGASKLLVAKLYGSPHRDVYLSASALSTGEAEGSAFRLSGNSLAPVGAGGASSLGASPSDSIESTCWELDCRLFDDRRASIALGFGGAELSDAAPFDRRLFWWQVLPRLALRPGLEAVLRVSEIRTSDPDEGYRFSGKPIALGEDLGYDAHLLRRVSGALAWTVNPHVVLKLELGRDRIELVPGSPLSADNGERTFFALEAVASF